MINMLNKLFKGSSQPTNFYVGNTVVNKMYLGTTLVYDNTPDVQDRTLFDGTAEYYNNTYITRLLNNNKTDQQSNGYVNVEKTGGQIVSTVTISPSSGRTATVYSSRYHNSEKINLTGYNTLEVKIDYQLQQGSNPSASNGYFAFQFWTTSNGDRLGGDIKFTITERAATLKTLTFDISSYNGDYYFGFLHYLSGTSACTLRMFIDSIRLLT